MGLGKLAVLKKRIPQIKEVTEKSRLAKRERQAERRKEKEKAKTPDFELEHPECGQTAEKVLTYKQVQAWLREGIAKRISWSISIPADCEWWGIKQKALARKLLDAYGGELVEKTIFYLCDNWEDMVRDRYMKFSGKPTIELIWAFRETLFTDAERNKPYVSPPKRAAYRPERNADEFKDPGAVGHGW